MIKGQKEDREDRVAAEFPTLRWEEYKEREHLVLKTWRKEQKLIHDSLLIKQNNSIIVDIATLINSWKPKIQPNVFLVSLILFMRQPKKIIALELLALFSLKHIGKKELSQCLRIFLVHSPQSSSPGWAVIFSSPGSSPSYLSWTCSSLRLTAWNYNHALAAFYLYIAFEIGSDWSFLSQIHVPGADFGVGHHVRFLQRCCPLGSPEEVCSARWNPLSQWGERHLCDKQQER